MCVCGIEKEEKKKIIVMGNCLVLWLGEAYKCTKWAFFKLEKQMQTNTYQHTLVQIEFCADSAEIHTHRQAGMQTGRGMGERIIILLVRRLLREYG